MLSTMAQWLLTGCRRCNGVLILCCAAGSAGGENEPTRHAGLGVIPVGEEPQHDSDQDDLEASCHMIMIDNKNDTEEDSAEGVMSATQTPRAEHGKDHVSVEMVRVYDACVAHLIHASVSAS
jgi:hypothetical protein